MTRRIIVLEDGESLGKEAAQMIADLAQSAVASRGRFDWVLSGGGTPEPLYRRLAQEPYRRVFPWSQTRVFWGDERCVPPAAAGSNYGQAWRLLLEHVAIPEENIFRIKGELTPPVAAQEYEEQLARIGEDGRRWPVFDIVLLGMGRDGHTASLFPGPIDKKEQMLPVMAVTAQYDGRPANRVTLTPVVFNDARHIFFLVTGADKKDTVTSVLGADGDPERWPVQRIRPHNGLVTWMLDRASASNLPPAMLRD